MSTFASGSVLRRGRGPLRRRPCTAVICHNVLPHERRPGDVALTRTLLAHVDTVIVHSAGITPTMRPNGLWCQRPVSVSPGGRPPLSPPVRGDPSPRPPLGAPVGPAPARLLFFGIVRP